MRNVLINSNGVYVSELDTIPDTIPPGFQLIEVEDENLFLHDKKQYVNGEWVDYDPLSLQDYKDLQWDRLKSDRDKDIDSGFVWNGHTFDSDPRSRSNIQDAVNMAILTPSFTVDWTLKDNTVVTLTSEDIKQVGQALATHINNCHVKGRGLREVVNNAVTKQQVESVVWNEPPPLPPGTPPGMVG